MVLNKCPNCKANLKLKNPDIAKTAFCEYCGSQVNLIDETFQKIEKDKYKPISNLYLGAEGSIHGIRYQVIGRIRYKDTKDFSWWDEWLLLSESGQYLWLQEDKWDFTLNHKFTPKEPFDPNEVRDELIIDGYHLELEDNSEAEIEYFEGELTWQAKLGGKIRYLDAWKGESTVYSVEWTDKEINYYIGKDKSVEEIYKNFNLGPVPDEALGDDDIGETPFQKMVSKLMDGPGFKFSLIFGLLLAVTALVFGYLGSNVKNLAIKNKISPKVIILGPYNLTQKGKVYRVDVKVKGIKNASLILGYTILNNKMKTVASYEQEYFSYSGFSDGERWREDRLKSTSWFVLKDPGKYSFKIVPKEKKVKWAGLDLTVKKGVFHTSPMWAISLIILIYPAIVLLLWLIANSHIPEDVED